MMKRLRINEQIHVRQVKLIDEHGKLIGIVNREEALRRAREAGLDLVEVAPQERPPVCKIMDFGKFKYRQKKKEKSARKHSAELKEIRLGLTISPRDYELKLAKAKEFLTSGARVKVSIRFRGRENLYRDKGKELIVNFANDLEEVAQVIDGPKTGGSLLTVLLAPK